MVEQVSGLILTIFYNVGFSIVCLTIFLVYRSLRAKPGAIFSETELSFCKAIQTVFFIDDTELAGYIHMEGYLYLNFIKNCGYFLLSCTVIASLTLIPIYANLELSSHMDLSNLSIKNKQLYDGDLIIPGACTLIIALGTFLLGYFYFLLPAAHPSLFPSVIYNQEESLKSLAVQSSTLFIEEIPIEINCNEAEKYIFDQIPIEYQSQIQSIKLYPNYEILYQLLQMKNQLSYKLDKIEYNEKRKFQLCICLNNRKANCLKELEIIENKLKCETEKVFMTNIGYGFLHLASQDTAQRLLKENLGLILHQAHCDSDLIWENLKQHKGLSIFKRIFANIIFIILFLVLFTPLALSSFISQLLGDLSLDLAYASQSLSSVVLSLFQYIIVPYSIRMLTQQEQYYLKSEVGSSRIFKYLLYTIMNIIIFPLIGTVTLTMFVQQMIKVEIFEWNVSFARNVGKVGEFFVNFVISMGFVSNVLDLLAFSSYFAGKVNEWKATTTYEERNAFLAPEFDFPHEYSKILMVFSVTLVFSISTPIILPFGVFYMFIKYAVDKYNVLFAYKISKNEGETTQKTVMTCLFIISSLFQMINSGIFIVSGQTILIWLGGILSALSVFTLIFSALQYKYWHIIQNFTSSKVWNIKYDFSNHYIHPCEEFLRSYHQNHLKSSV